MTINVDFYLIIDQKFSAAGHAIGTPGIRTAKKKPSCSSYEVAIALNLSLPDSLFKRPSFQARIEIPEGQAPTVITPEISENIATALKEQFGITLNIAAPSDSVEEGKL